MLKNTSLLPPVFSLVLSKDQAVIQFQWLGVSFTIRQTELAANAPLPLFTPVCYPRLIGCLECMLANEFAQSALGQSSEVEYELSDVGFRFHGGTLFHQQ